MGKVICSVLALGIPAVLAGANHGHANHGHSYEAGVDGHHYQGDPCLKFDKKLCERTSACEWRTVGHGGQGSHQGVGNPAVAGYKGSEESHCAALPASKREHSSTIAAKFESWGMTPHAEDAVCGEFFTKQDCKYANNLERAAFRPARCQWHACGGNGVAQPYCGNVDEEDNHGHRKHASVWDELTESLDLPCVENPTQFCAALGLAVQNVDDSLANVAAAVLNLSGKKAFPPYLRAQITSEYAQCKSGCNDHYWFYDGETNLGMFGALIRNCLEGKPTTGLPANVGFDPQDACFKRRRSLLLLDDDDDDDDDDSNSTSTHGFEDPMPSVSELLCYAAPCEMMERTDGSGFFNATDVEGDLSDNVAYALLLNEYEYEYDGPMSESRSEPPNDIPDITKVYTMMAARGQAKFCAKSNEQYVQMYAAEQRIPLCPDAATNLALCATPTPTPTTPTPTPTPTPTETD